MDSNPNYLKVPRHTQSLPAENRLLRKLKGPQGSQVKALEKAHSVHIQLQDGSVEISGSSPEAVNNAVQEIENVSNNFSVPCELHFTATF